MNLQNKKYGRIAGLFAMLVLRSAFAEPERVPTSIGFETWVSREVCDGEKRCVSETSSDENVHARLNFRPSEKVQGEWVADWQRGYSLWGQTSFAVFIKAEVRGLHGSGKETYRFSVHVAHTQEMSAPPRVELNVDPRRLAGSFRGNVLTDGDRKITPVFHLAPAVLGANSQ